MSHGDVHFVSFRKEVIKIKNILITGGAGFIGLNFISKMVQDKNNQIINLDKLTYAANLDNLTKLNENSNYIFIHGDICDREIVNNIFERYNIDYVVNFAAESHVDNSLSLIHISEPTR